MKLKMIINIFGGPGVGKSTVATELFSKMKKDGYSVELVTEYAKELTYEKRYNVLDDDQIYIFAKQHRRIFRLKDQVEYIITDSPLLLSTVYSTLNKTTNVFDLEFFIPLILNVNNKYNNVNILLERNEKFEYKEEGRAQTEDEAKQVDQFLRSTILKYCQSIIEIINNDNTTPKIMNYIEDKINELG